MQASGTLRYKITFRLVLLGKCLGLVDTSLLEPCEKRATLVCQLEALQQLRRRSVLHLHPLQFVWDPPPPRSGLSRQHRPHFGLSCVLFSCPRPPQRGRLAPTNASSGFQNVTKKLQDPELTQKVSASAAWGWGAISTQAGSLWSKAAETVGAISEGCVLGSVVEARRCALRRGLRWRPTYLYSGVVYCCT